MFGDLEGMPMLLPLHDVAPAPEKSSAHVLDVFRQASMPLHRRRAHAKPCELILTQLQRAFDSCNLPIGDRVCFAGVVQLSHSCALEVSSLPVVSTLCHAWLHRMRRNRSLAECLEPVAAAVKELLPAPVSDADQAWGVRPHQSSSGWMSTWRIWRAVANALHMSGILQPALANNVTRTRACRFFSLKQSLALSEGVCRRAEWGSCPSPTWRLRPSPCLARLQLVRRCFKSRMNQTYSNLVRQQQCRHRRLRA